MSKQPLTVAPDRAQLLQEERGANRFEQWMENVDVILANATGLWTKDIDERDYAGMFESGTSVAECVEAIIEAGIEYDYRLFPAAQYNKA